MQPALHPHELEAAMAELLTSRRFPKQWYQHKKVRTVFAVLITLLGYLSISLFGFRPPLSLSLISVLILGLAVTADVLSTYQVSSLKKKYDAQGIEFSVREANPLLPDVPGLRDLVSGKPMLLDVVAGLITIFIPLAGLGVAGLHFIHGWLNNTRIYQQSLYELDLLDKMRLKD
jgi:hypothetical protein